MSPIISVSSPACRLSEGLRCQDTNAFWRPRRLHACCRKKDMVAYLGVSRFRLGIFCLSGMLFGQQRFRSGRLGSGSGSSLCLGLLQLLTHLHNSVVRGGIC